MNVLRTLALTLLLAACATTPPPTPGAVADLAPTGTLRIGMPIFDVFVGGRDARTALYAGVAPDLARSLAAALGVPFAIVPYSNESTLAVSAGRNEWDIAFVALDRKLLLGIDFSRTFMAADFTYVVPEDNPRIRAIVDADKDDVRIAVPASGAAIDLLQRRYPAKQFVPVAGGKIAMLAVFNAGRADAYAESAHTLSGMASQNTGLRILEGRYAVAEYVVAVRTNRAAALAYVNRFLDAAKASGEIEKAIGKAGLLRVNVVASPAAQ